MSNIVDIYLQQTCILYKRTGVTGYNEQQYDAGTELKCRWHLKQKKLSDAEGEEFVSSAEIWLPPGSGAAIGDELEYAGQRYPVRSVGEAVDAFGKATHLQVFV